MLAGCMGHGNVAEHVRTDDRRDEEEILSLAQEWEKSSHFQRFLRQELVRARTEAEKEVVRAELAVVSRRLAQLKEWLSKIVGLEEAVHSDGTEKRTFALTLQ